MVKLWLLPLRRKMFIVAVLLTLSKVSRRRGRDAEKNSGASIAVPPAERKSVDACQAKVPSA